MLITKHSVTEFSLFYLMFGINPRQPIDVLIENNTDEQTTPSTYIEKWKSSMKEAFTNTKWRRDMGKRKRERARLQHLDVGAECWLETLMKEEDLLKQEHFGKRNYIKFLKRKMKMV